jgi:hypothetical protein
MCLRTDEDGEAAGCEGYDIWRNDRARWRSGNAAVCKTAMRGFDSRPCLMGHWYWRTGSETNGGPALADSADQGSRVKTASRTARQCPPKRVPASEEASGISARISSTVVYLYVVILHFDFLVLHFRHARVAELVYAEDLKSFTG